MFTRQDLQDLVNSDTQGHPVLSLYLTTDLTQHLKEERRLALKKLLDPLGEDAQPDVERAQKFFDHEFDWQAQGIALFSSAGAGFWRVIRLAVPILDFATIEPRPNVGLLADALDEHACYVVALVDRDHARFFAMQMGEITEFSPELPPTPGRQKQGGPSAARFQRHADALALQNLKQAARLAHGFFNSRECSRLLLAGTEDVLVQFRGLLTKTWQKRIVGEFAMDMHAPANTVLAKAQELVAHFERDQEAAQVEELTTAARKKRATATLGLADTLNALLEGKVMTLVAAANYSAEGYVCDNCGFLAAQKVDRCPLCGANMRAVDHMVELAIHKALRLGSRVEIVHDPAAAKLKALGAIGAMLRF
ncbi:MAG: hypothetical protein HY782_20450 [Chloroflexi bacterium]|nr:hypothetical protein [Chloroflexota bacterium]